MRRRQRAIFPAGSLMDQTTAVLPVRWPQAAGDGLLSLSRDRQPSAYESTSAFVLLCFVLRVAPLRRTMTRGGKRHLLTPHFSYKVFPSHLLPRYQFQKCFSRASSALKKSTCWPEGRLLLLYFMFFSKGPDATSCNASSRCGNAPW